ncbi:MULTISPECIES: hypothetical protein [Lysobacter]|uniref:hypothetical protein n=1 Tax=Lysobacter TaxID=68 RepID=UPI001F2CBAC9|nr:MULTISPECIES: hypothetical protein [Lysobacter]UJB21613.1 hypothetical protein L1A79_11415 [Lysobacter capsici]UJQ29270.1 hypothetical protein L2D09_03450 [Lysobacter gummosus]
MTRSLYRLATPALLAMALALPLAAVAEDDAPYKDKAELQAELTKVLTCQASRAEYMRFASALTDVYYDKPAQLVLAGWKKVEDANAFVAMIDMPEPVTVYGHKSRQLMLAGQGMLAVVDGDHADALAKQLKLGAGGEPLAGHIRVRDVRTEALGDGIEAKIVQTVSTITTHPGKTMVGCEYRVNY